MRPDDLAATDGAGRAGQGAGARPGGHRRPHAGLRAAGRRVGVQPGARVAVRLGYDHLPGTTITRYCSSSLQTTRMAMHAIKAGEGDVFISAGVETVSRFATGNSDSLPDTQNPLFADAKARTATAAAGAATSGTTRARTARCRTCTSPWARPPRTWPLLSGVSRHEQDEFARPVAEPRREGDRGRLLRPGDQPGDAARRHRGRHRRRAAGRASPSRQSPAQAGVPAGRHGHGRQLLPPQRRRGRAGRHERAQGSRARAHPAGPDRRDRPVRALAGDHGTRSGARRLGVHWRTPA